jgi:hypothetical protein
MVLALSMGAAIAARTLELVEGAYELVLADVIMPASTAGTTIFKVCASCDSIGLPVNASTRYLIDGGELALPDFLEGVEEIRQATGGDASVGVYYDLQTNRVTRIAVVVPRG